jgi:cytochrome P450
MDAQQAGQVFVDPTAYADEARLHEAFEVLRRESPVHWVEAEGFNPFWAITRHADVAEIETNVSVFRNDPRAVLLPAVVDAQPAPLKTLIHIDAPDHTALRGLTAPWFHHKMVKQMTDRMSGLAREHVDRMAASDGECDFARDVAMYFPIQVINSLLGLPDEDVPRMLKLTQELFGSSDPELRRGETAEDAQAVVLDFFTYFNALTLERRANPTEDLASVIANAEIDGRELNPGELMSYYIIIATAGHDTTSSTISGGLLALLENPEELQRLRDDPSLMATAADEMIRWVTPVKHFMRTAMEDYPLRDVTIRQGQSVLLSYPSANRDEDAFEDPMRFDVGRTPNKHLAFGLGPHFCLGATLARLEIQAIFNEMLPRLEWIELAGDAEFMQTTFVGGPKHLPVRYKMRA